MTASVVLELAANPFECARRPLRALWMFREVQQVPGGVGRNIAEGLSRLVGAALPPPLLATLLGDDAAGSLLLSNLQTLRLDLCLLVQRTGVPTPCVTAVFDKSGEVAACVADVAALEQHFTPSLVSELLLTWPTPRASLAAGPRNSSSSCNAGSSYLLAGPVHAASLLVVEANLSEGAIQAACAAAAAAHVAVFMEPVSVPKSARCVPVLPQLAYIKPNAAELVAMADVVRQRQGLHLLPRPGSDGSGTAVNMQPPNDQDSQDRGVDGRSRARSGAAAWQLPVQLVQQLPFAAVLLRAGVRCIVLTLGAEGAALITLQQQSSKQGQHQQQQSSQQQRQQSSQQQQQQQGAHHAQQQLLPQHCHASLLAQGLSLAVPAADAAGGHMASLHVAHMRALPVQAANLSGAGDSLVAGMSAALLRGRPPMEALAYGMAAAKLAVQSHSNVPQSMTFDDLEEDAMRTLSTLQLRQVMVTW